MYTCLCVCVCIYKVAPDRRTVGEAGPKQAAAQSGRRRECKTAR